MQGKPDTGPLHQLERLLTSAKRTLCPAALAVATIPGSAVLNVAQAAGIEFQPKLMTLARIVVAFGLPARMVASNVVMSLCICVAECPWPQSFVPRCTRMKSAFRGNHLFAMPLIWRCDDNIVCAAALVCACTSIRERWYRATNLGNSPTRMTFVCSLLERNVSRAVKLSTDHCKRGVACSVNKTSVA